MNETPRPLVLGLLGEKGCGKDTVAGILRTKYAFLTTSFGKRLYQEVAQAFPCADIPRLTERDLKETPVEALALRNCIDYDFIAVALAAEDPSGASGMGAPRSLRWILQTYGTSYRRARQTDYWTRPVVEEDIGANPHAEHVVSDVRFFNEVDTIWQVSGLTVRIRADWLEDLSKDDLYAGHVSETQVAAVSTEFTLLNRRGDLDGLTLQVDEMVRQARRRILRSEAA